MKHILTALSIVLILSTIAIAADQRVRGYWRDTDGDGFKDRYVDSYHRTTPNTSRFDNYSSQGNINPWTGQSGTVDPYRNEYPQNNPYKNRRY